jgi:hypothetical protein
VKRRSIGDWVLVIGDWLADWVMVRLGMEGQIAALQMVKSPFQLQYRQSLCRQC